MDEKKSKFVIRFNKEQCGIELIVPDGRRLSTEEKAVLSSLGFAWHKKNCYYYTRYTDEKMEIIKTSFLGKDATFPAVSQNKILSQMAAQRAAEAAKKKENATKKPSSSNAELNAKLDKLIELMTLQALAQKQ